MLKMTVFLTVLFIFIAVICLTAASPIILSFYFGTWLCMFLYLVIWGLVIFEVIAALAVFQVLEALDWI